ILGVSTLEPSILEAMKTGASHFYVMEELHQIAGEVIAGHMETEAAFITNSASSGIALSVAGVITGEHTNQVQQLFNEQLFPEREILLMKGHHIDYGAPIGTMVQLGGGIVKE